MSQRLRRSLVAGLCAVVCTGAAAVSLWLPSGALRTLDRNGDGRPDTWRLYDRRGQLSEVTVDTNFDGRPDVHEYYQRGSLVRRESDRNFNDRVDLVQEFDPATREHTRSVVDVDFDGRADLLVLFRDGKPVFSKWSPPVAPVAASTVALYADAWPSGSRDLASLEDPFSRDLSISAARRAVPSGEYVGLSTTGGLPASGDDVVGPLASSSDISGARVSRSSSALVVPYSPRGPPVPHLS